MPAPPSLRKIHPMGTSPVISDGDLTLAESGAIVEYLVERYGEGRLSPVSGTPAYLRYRYWLHYAEGSLISPLLLKLVFDKIEKSPKPFAKAIAGKTKTAFITPQMTTHLDYLESERRQSTWFVSDLFSAADTQPSFPVEAAAARGGLDSSRPRLME